MCLPSLYTPCCVYTIFRTHSGPIGNSRSVAEDINPLIRPHAAPVPCYYKSHVSSKCITLQQESHHPPLRRQIQIYCPVHFHSSTMTKTYGRTTQHSPAFCERFSPTQKNSPFLLPLILFHIPVVVKAVDWS